MGVKHLIIYSPSFLNNPEIHLPTLNQTLEPIIYGVYTNWGLSFAYVCSCNCPAI